MIEVFDVMAVGRAGTAEGRYVGLEAGLVGRARGASRTAYPSKTVALGFSRRANAGGGDHRVVLGADGTGICKLRDALNPDHLQRDGRALRRARRVGGGCAGLLRGRVQGHPDDTAGLYPLVTSEDERRQHLVGRGGVGQPSAHKLVEVAAIRSGVLQDPEIHLGDLVDQRAPGGCRSWAIRRGGRRGDLGKRGKLRQGPVRVGEGVVPVLGNEARER